MRLLAIDPGPEKTAWVEFDSDRFEILDKAIEQNRQVADMLMREAYGAVAIEYPRPRGQPMYTQLVDTICWIGRFANACNEKWVRVDRKDVKMTICGNTRATDSHIRAALISIFDERLQKNKGRGGNIPAIGNKAFPGPLLGVSKDLWAALAVAVTWTEGQKVLEKALS